MADRTSVLLMVMLLLVSHVSAGKTWQEIRRAIWNFIRNIARCNSVDDRAFRGELTSRDCTRHCSPLRGRCVPVTIFWIVEVRQVLTCECLFSFSLSTFPRTEWTTTDNPSSSPELPSVTSTETTTESPTTPYPEQTTLTSTDLPTETPTTPSPDLTSVTSINDPYETTTTTEDQDTRLTSPYVTTPFYSLTSPTVNIPVDANVSQECVSAEACSAFCQSLGNTAGVCDMGYFDPSTNTVQVLCLCIAGDPTSNASPPPPPTATAAPATQGPDITIPVIITYFDQRCSGAENGYASSCFNFCVANNYEVGICFIVAQLYNNPATAQVRCLCLNITSHPQGPSPDPTLTTEAVTQPSEPPTCQFIEGAYYASCTDYCVSIDFEDGECVYDPPESNEAVCYCYDYTIVTPATEQITTDTISSPETPGYPSSPETPGYPSSPETPSYPSYPSYYETPGYPSSPETPGYPSYPSFYATPSNPSSPAPTGGTKTKPPPTYIYVLVTPSIKKKLDADCLAQCKKAGYPKGHAEKVTDIGKNRRRVRCICDY